MRGAGNTAGATLGLGVKELGKMVDVGGHEEAINTKINETITVLASPDSSTQQLTKW